MRVYQDLSHLPPETAISSFPDVRIRAHAFIAKRILIGCCGIFFGSTPSLQPRKITLMNSIGAEQPCLTKPWPIPKNPYRMPASQPQTAETSRPGEPPRPP